MSTSFGSPFPQLASLAQYRSFAAKLPKTRSEQISIGVVSTFTHTGLLDCIQVLTHESGISTALYESPYKQHVQVILNPKSKLYTAKPQSIFVLLDPVSVIPRLYDNNISHSSTSVINSAWNYIKQLLQALESNSKAQIVLTTLVSAPDTYLGLFDSKYQVSPSQITTTVNRRLVQYTQKSHRVSVLDMQQFFLRYGYYQAHSNKMYHAGDYYIEPSHLPALAYALVGYVKSLRGKGRKCIVLDLDNTLWGGVIGEDGLSGIQLGPTPPGNAFVDFQKTLLTLHSRGVLLAINSANNRADVLEVFEKHPHMVLKIKHFAAMQINWNSKAENMKHLAKNINIGLDSMVFVDDDPKKRLLVGKLLPEVLTLDLPNDPSNYSQAILSLNDFSQANLTKEDFSRGKKYFAQSRRRSFKQNTADLKSYLRALDIRISFVPIDNFSIPRIAQLTQRTNQFNMTTKRYSEQDIISFSHNSNYQIYAVEVIDKFGSYGICGVLIAKKEDSAIDIDTFLLSCRVLGLDIELELLHCLTKKALLENIRTLTGTFVKTAKNAPAANVYRNAGFSKTKSSNTSTIWKLQFSKALPKSDHIKLLSHDGKKG